MHADLNLSRGYDTKSYLPLYREFPSYHWHDNSLETQKDEQDLYHEPQQQNQPKNALKIAFLFLHSFENVVFEYLPRNSFSYGFIKDL